MHTDVIPCFVFCEAHSQIDHCQRVVNKYKLVMHELVAMLLCLDCGRPHARLKRSPTFVADVII